MPATVQLPDLVRGDVMSQPVNFTSTGFNFTGVVARSAMRRQGESKANQSHTFILSPTVPGLGQCGVVLNMTPTETQALEAGCFAGEIVLEITDSWGPYTVIDYTLNVLTRDGRTP